MKSFDIQKTKKACEISVKILKQLITELRKHSFKTELDIYDYLKEQTKLANCKLAFKPVIATGKNAFEIHHKANDTKLQKGFLVVDFGVKFKGYCSDITRTFYLGKPSKKEIHLYNLVLEAQETALIHALPGVDGADLDLIARNILLKHFKNFVHGLGHGVGKKIHQGPSLSPRRSSKLKLNQTVTIEPGLYFKNKLGIRIEDTILIKEKPIILTKLTKKLVII